MMVTVLNRQSLFDIAIQYRGSAEAAFEIAALNDLSITDELESGQQLEVETGRAPSLHVVNYYRTNGVVPATAPPSLPEGEETEIGTGDGYVEDGYVEDGYIGNGDGYMADGYVAANYI